jgi:mono/diheme cytochrome c family protein
MKLGSIAIVFVLLVITVVSIAGFRGDKFTKPPFEIFPDMNYQEKVKDQVPSAFFADGMGARPPISGTVAEEMPGQNDYGSTGKWDETHWGDGIPVHDSVNGGRPLQIDAENMARGRERYTISCEVCHGGVGDGKGITSQYGLNGAASYQTDRLRTASAGDIFNTITNGKGQMLGYGYNIAIDDRWRIIMYIRALQRSQNATYADASSEEQAELDKARKPATPPPAPAAAPTDAAPSAAPSPGAPSTIVPPVTTPAPAKPPGTTQNGANKTHTAANSLKSSPVVYLSQTTMENWVGRADISF